MGALPAVAHGDNGHHGAGHQANFPASIALPNGFRPEGVTSGPGKIFYAGSVSDGRIWRGDLRTGTGGLLVPAVAGRSLRGMQYDERTRLLWVVGSDAAVAKVWALNPSSGAVVRTITVPGGLFLNDLVVTRRAVWVTDSFADRLTRISLTDEYGAGTGEPTFVAITGAWPATKPNTFGANGIRQLPDGKLVLDNSAAGGLYVVARGSGVATTIPVTGGAITSGDGLELRDKMLYVVRGSGKSDVSVLKLKREDGVWRARFKGVLTSPQLDVPSTGTIAAGALYVVNARFGTANPDTATYTVTRLPLRAGEKDDDRAHRVSRD